MAIFYIASHRFIALPIIATVIVVALTEVTENFLLSLLISRKSDNYRNRAIFKSNNYRKSNNEKNETKKRRLIAVTLQDAIEKSHILLSQYWKH